MKNSFKSLLRALKTFLEEIYIKDKKMSSNGFKMLL